MADSNPAAIASELFVQHLTNAQTPLYAFICSLSGGSSRARDVLQETNLALWRKSAEYDPNRDFLSWAFSFARLQVMADLKRHTRDRVVFDEGLLEQIAQSAQQRNRDLNDRLQALDGCLQKLPLQHQALLRRRYHDGDSIADICDEFGQTATAIYTLLHRIRLALASCIQSGLLPKESK